MCRGHSLTGWEKSSNMTWVFCRSPPSTSTNTVAVYTSHERCHNSQYSITSLSVFSFLRRLTTWHCPHLPAAAAERWPAVQQSIDISCPLQPTAASLQQRVCCCGVMLGQTDRETNGHRTVRYTVDPAPHTMMAVLTTTTRWPKIIQQQATSQRKASLYGKI